MIKWKSTKSVAQARAIVDAFTACEYEASRAISHIRHEFTNYDKLYEDGCCTALEEFDNKVAVTKLLLEKLPEHEKAILDSFTKSLKRVTKAAKQPLSPEPLGVAGTHEEMDNLFRESTNTDPEKGSHAVFRGKKGLNYKYIRSNAGTWRRSTKQ